MINKWKILLSHFFILSAVGLVFFIPRPVHATISQSDIVSFWTLDETSTPYTDVIGNNDGADAASGAPTPTTAGQINGAQVFTRDNADGSAGDGIDIPCNHCGLDWGTGNSFSIEFWMKGIPGTTGAGTNPEVMIGRNEVVNQPQWWIGVTTSKNIRWYIADSSGDSAGLNASPAVDASDGQWHHIVCVRDADNNKLHLYVDNVDTEIDKTFAAGFESTADLNLGYMLGEFHFSGALDEVAIYNRALTATEVQEHFNKTGGPRYVVDLDGDGISDGEENAGPNNGDGNQDGIPDMNQNTVVSMLTKSGTNYVTLETSAGTFANCQAVDKPSPGDAPTNAVFPLGFFNFTINDLNPGDPATVTMKTPAGTAPDTYYKYGPPTPGEADAWYEFKDDGTTGATVNSDIVSLKFVDGQRGDDTAADGSIVDQGGPAILLLIPPDGGGGGGGGGTQKAMPWVPLLLLDD